MEWISVKDKLPEARRTVLTWHPIYQNQYTMYQTNGVFYHKGGETEPYDVTTHWAYLPEIPKELK